MTGEKMTDDTEAKFSEIAERIYPKLDPIVEIAYSDMPPAIDLGIELTGTEARLLREHLGLSQDWLARAVGVERRSFTRWEKRSTPVKQDVADLLLALSNEASQIVFTLSEDYKEGTRTEPLRVWDSEESFQEANRFRYTAEWHRAICRRILSKLAETDQTGLVHIAYTDSPDGAKDPASYGGRRIDARNAISKAAAALTPHLREHGVDIANLLIGKRYDNLNSHKWRWDQLLQYLRVSPGKLPAPEKRLVTIASLAIEDAIEHDNSHGWVPEWIFKSDQ
jgi:transcriptional regulator with XRE-family HTH domain